MFPPGAASLVTASNINTSFKVGVSVGDFSSSSITIAGTRIAATDISGIVCSIAYFLPLEFYYVEPADRRYVCAEVTAFFIYFLSELGCKKVNPPSSRALSGLGMHRIEWMQAAHAQGVPIWPTRLKNGLSVEVDPPLPTTFRATIVGGAVVEPEIPERVQEYLATLSRAFSMPYLCADFVSPRQGEFSLVDLRSVPDVSTRANREAIVRFMEAPPA
jgi:hypothetical protein